ncbi:metalloregulator ArsR/SmtB family transcription factor [Iamia sp. SCSIO 61187]|nr:metalloregulator ArsR/SmtB family transcription factor [Iamia sp. SCSIO 61187]
MLQLLAQGERGVQDLAGIAGLNLTTASAHLQTLRAAGLVASQRDGTRVIYRLAGDDVASLLTTLCRVAEAHRPEVRAEVAAALPSDDLVSMSRSELLEASAAGRVVVLDVRPDDEFAARHLPGALSIPLAELLGRLDEVPADVEIVAYCRGRHCLLSHDAARLLRDRGFAARASEDGVAEWVADGVALEPGAAA